MYTEQRVFDESSHERFARASRDFNPIHVDAAVARRTVAGVRVVHGIHSLLWALECFARSELATSRVTSLKVQFPQPAYVGDTEVLEILPTAAGQVRIRSTVSGEEVLTVTLGQAKDSDPPFPATAAAAPSTEPPDLPIERDMNEMETVAGCLALSGHEELAAMFPSAAELFGRQRLATFAGFSCLVGMVVPGLHSMFSGLDMSFIENESVAGDALQYAVVAATSRFRLVRIAVRTRGASGVLDTFSRMPPRRQVPVRSLVSRVSPEEFRGSTALIVGGSRGLGELTAKLVAAGGADVIVSYAAGMADARALEAELTQEGFRCRTLQYDVRQAARAQLAKLRVPPTHVYYFATPPIFRRKSGLMDADRHDEFHRYYVTAFYDLVMACLDLRAEGIRVFYPSTTSIDSRPATMTEYTMAKAAGEVLCSDLTKYVRGANVLYRRLPRLPTDQTNSAVRQNDGDPVEVLLPIVRELHRPASCHIATSLD